MKRFLYVLLANIVSFLGFAQSNSISYLQTDSISTIEVSDKQLLAHLDSIVEEIDELIHNAVSLRIDEYRNRYKMYQTENMYNLLKLDTQTGKIEQVQWSLDEDKEFSISINSEDLSLSNTINSFELYPTP